MGFLNFFNSSKANANGFQPFNDEFSMELSTEPYGTTIKELDNSYSSNGVEIHDTRNTLRVLYSGILVQNGAQDIYTVIGYGDNCNWEGVQEYPMHKLSDEKFELIFPVTRAGEINMAFKDSAENWDNNSGRNFVFTNYVYEGSH